jgi:hypothetical protein
MQISNSGKPCQQIIANTKNVSELGRGTVMEDMALTARLFETSSRLRLASSWLERIAEGGEPNTEGKDTLKWAGQFMCEVDWSSPTTHKASVGGGFALQATTVRPTFYSSLFRLAPRLRKAGMEKEEDVLSFLSSLYHNLISSGAPGKGHKKLSPEYSKLGAILLQEISKSILVQLSNNGLPRTKTTLREDWELASDEFVSLGSAIQ